MNIKGNIIWNVCGTEIWTNWLYQHICIRLISAKCTWYFLGKRPKLDFMFGLKHWRMNFWDTSYVPMWLWLINKYFMTSAIVIHFYPTYFFLQIEHLEFLKVINEIACSSIYTPGCHYQVFLFRMFLSGWSSNKGCLLLFL